MVHTTNPHDITLHVEALASDVGANDLMLIGTLPDGQSASINFTVTVVIACQAPTTPLTVTDVTYDRGISPDIFQFPAFTVAGCVFTYKMCNAGCSYVFPTLSAARRFNPTTK